MKSAVKTLALITTAVFILGPASAQLKLTPTSSIGNDLQKVIADYPNQFKNLIGELIARHPQSADYSCNFLVQGAEETSITNYSSARTEICSWQALMLTTESFDKAKQKLRTLFNQLNNLAVGSFQLRGNWESPVEEKKFTSVLFSFFPEEGALQKLKVEISMVY